MTFLLAPKRKRLIFVLKVVCPQYTSSLPDSGYCYFQVFQNACPNLTFACPGQSGKCLCSTLASACACARDSALWPVNQTHRAKHANSKSTGGTNDIFSVESQKALSLFKDALSLYIPLRTRRELLPLTLYNDSTLLVLNGTSLNIDCTLLALN